MSTDTTDAVGGQVIDLATARSRGGRPPPPSGEGLLQRVALVLSSTLELREVLARLVDMALEVSGAQRCSIFLLRDGRLEPGVAAGTSDDERLWRAFREMPPIHVTAHANAWSRLAAGETVVVSDARASGDLPDSWVERFDLRAVVIAPLLSGTEPCGLLVIDDPDPSRFGDDQVRLITSLAAYAGLAVTNARTYEDARRRALIQEALARSAASLATSTRPTAIAETLVGAYTDLLGANLCAIGLLDEGHTRLTTIASRGGSGPRGPVPLAAVPEHVVARLTEVWSEDAHAPVEFGEQPTLAALVGGPPVGFHLVLPVTVGARPRGAVLLGFPASHRLDTEARTAAAALADLAAAALERAMLLEKLDRHARHMEALYAASTAIVEGADARAVVERLNGLLAPQGLEISGIVLRDRDLADRLAAPPPNRAERSAWRSGEPALVDDSRSIPMRLGRRIVGGLRVRPSELEPDDVAFLEAVGRGVAEVASRGSLRTALEDAARDRAIAAERDRIADDLHDTVGQLFVAIGLLARRSIEQLPSDSRWGGRFGRIGELAESGKWEIDQAVRALAHVPAADHGLLAALTDLADAFGTDSGIAAVVDVDGRAATLPAAVDRALYRVAHEALTNAWRHARCSTVRIELGFDRDEVTLRIRDDGIGLPPASGSSPGVGIATMRRATKELGGSLRVGPARPRGVLVEARVPREPR